MFAGAGGGLLATHHLLGWQCIGYVEKEEYPCKVLEARINDGLLSPAPIFQMHTGDFIRLGYPAKYRGLVDVITAGFPCQPFSGAGLGLADKDPRNGWPDTISIIRLVRPQYVLLENVSRLVSSPYFGAILSDLAQSGYDCRWDCVPASAIGANHERDRLWIVAYSDSTEWGPCGPAGRDMARDDNGLHTGGEETTGRARERGQAMADTNGSNGYGRGGAVQMGRIRSQETAKTNRNIRRIEWGAEPGLGRVANGVAYRVDRLKAIGNGQVPGVVREVWEILTKNINGRS